MNQNKITYHIYYNITFYCFRFSDSEDALNEVVEETPLPIDLPKLPEDPFLSPYFANDDLFKQLPPIHIVV